MIPEQCPARLRWPGAHFAHFCCLVSDRSVWDALWRLKLCKDTSGQLGTSSAEELRGEAAHKALGKDIFFLWLAGAAGLKGTVPAVLRHEVGGRGARRGLRRRSKVK